MKAKLKKLLCLFLLAGFVTVLMADVANAGAVQPPGYVTPQDRAMNACESLDTGIIMCLYSKAIADACWICPAFAAFYSGALSLGYTISTKIAGELVKLICVALGIWLLFQITKIFLPLGPAAGIGETFNKIASKIFLLIFLLAFISGGGTGFGNVWNYIISPIFNTGVGLAGVTLQSANEIVGSSGDFNGIPLEVKTGSYCNVTQNTYANFASLGDSRKFSPSASADAIDTGKKLLCQISSVQNVMGTGLVMGLYIIKMGISGVKFSFNVGQVINSFAAALYSIIMGAALIVVFLIAMLLYPLYVVDAMFKFAVVIAISPILIGAYLFEWTRGWSIAGVKAIVASGASLMFQALILGLSLAMIVETNNAVKQILMSSGVVGDFLDNMAINSPFSIAQLVVFGYATAGILVLFMMRQANRLVQEFIGVGVGEIGSNLAGALGAKGVGAAGTMALAAATGGASMLAGGAAAAAGAAGGAGGGGGAAAAAGGGGGGGFGGVMGGFTGGGSGGSGGGGSGGGGPPPMGGGGAGAAGSSGAPPAGGGSGGYSGGTSPRALPPTSPPASTGGGGAPLSSGGGGGGGSSAPRSSSGSSMPTARWGRSVEGAASALDRAVADSDSGMTPAQTEAERIRREDNARLNNLFRRDPAPARDGDDSDKK